MSDLKTVMVTRPSSSMSMPITALGVLMRRYLAASLVVLEAGDGERLKATSRLYEHWVFLRLAEALPILWTARG